MSSVMKRVVFVLNGVFLLLLILIANHAMAGGKIIGNVTCKNVRNPGSTIVYIEEVRGVFTPADKHAEIDQNYFTFIPHVLPVLVGTTVDFPNSDVVRHSVFSRQGSASVFDLGIYDVGLTKSVTFDKVGETTLLCTVHPEMAAHVIALQNPYFTVTDETGDFAIYDVPPGEYALTTWHERLKPVSHGIRIREGNNVKVNFTLKNKR